MQRSRLNLTALCQYNQPADKNGGTLSRRDMLGITGTTAVGASPALHAINSQLGNTFELVGDKRRIAFTVRGKERWIIDTRRFAGSPTLKVTRSKRAIRVELSGARYPGTNLPADFICNLRPALTGWRMRLKMALGGSFADTPFERWLTGDMVARGQVRIRPSTFSLGHGLGIAVGGHAGAEFAPTWHLHLRGSQLVRISGPGSDLQADDVILSLLAQSAPSIVSRPVARRTELTLERGTRDWKLPIEDHAGSGWSLASQDSVFDRVRVEIGEPRVGENRAGILADAGPGEARLFFKLDASVGRNSADPFRLPLLQPRYAVAVDQSGIETALTATYGGPVWLNVAGCGLHIGGHNDTEPFTFVQREGKDTLRCAPPLFALATPVSGAVSELAAVPSGQRVAFITDPADEAHVKHRANRAQVHIHGPHRLRPMLTVANPTVSVIRPQDLLVLTFGFQNLDLNTSPGTLPTLTVHDPTLPAYLGVQFPPQHFDEQVNPESVNPPYPALYPIGSVTVPAIAFAARPSQLVFKVPSDTPAIDFTLQSLLDWNRWQLSTPRMAVAPGKVPDRLVTEVFVSRPAQPAGTETALSLPYRLVLSPPNKLNSADLPAFSHSQGEVTHEGRTELWHTRYAAKSGTDGTIQEVPGDSRLTLRAVWSPDFPTPAPTAFADPALNTHTPYDSAGRTAAVNRADLVSVTSDFSGYDFSIFALAGQYVPAPLSTNRLMLTALGTWLDAGGSWNDPAVPLVEWRNRTTMGRDHYVKIVTRGYLFPFGHHATQISVTEREILQFGTDSSQPAIQFACLIQRTFILVTQHEKTYTPADFPSGWDTPQAHARKMPFKRIRITTDVTPAVDPVNVPLPGKVAGTAYFVNVNGSRFPFHCIAEDMEGKQVEFGAPAIFIQDDGTTPNDAGLMTAVANAYTGDAASTFDLAGQVVLFAEKSPLTSLAKDQNLEAVAVKLGANIPPDGITPPGSSTVALPTGQPRYFPVLDHATVHIPAVAQLVGQGNSTDITLNATYINHGLDPATNVGQVFADVPTPLSMTYGGNAQAPTSPGIITPNMAISALSATAGPIGGKASDFVAGTFDPKAFFGGLLGKDSPSILGGIKLGDILALATGITDAGALIDNVPKLVQQKLPNEIDTTLTWTSAVKADPAGTFVPDPGTQIQIVGTRKVFLNGATPQFEISGNLGPFTLSLLSSAPVIKVPFKSFAFRVRDGQKMEVTPSLGDVQFLPPLDFVQTLEGYLSSILGDGAYIDIQATSVTAGFKLLIPSVGTGFFDIMNIALGAGVTIPFTGDPVRLRFDFSSKEHPFTMAVLCLGGGGFFSLAVGADGIEAMDAALEVGGILAVNLVIASGEIHAMLGIYFHWDKDDLSLTGYVRFGGEVSVMGLISVGIEFYIGVTYDFTHHDLYGRGELSLEVSIAFFSKTFSASIEKRIPSPSSASSGASRSLRQSRAKALMSPPNVSDALTQTDWTTYCNAFA